MMSSKKRWSSPNGLVNIEFWKDCRRRPKRWEEFALRIEAYFRQVQEIIEACPVIDVSSVTFEKRSTYVGYIRGELIFLNGSTLHFREYIDIEDAAEHRLMYVYQYINSGKELIFRYDNTGHHKKLGLSSYPHHKHEGSEDSILPATAPDLSNILHEIELLIQLPWTD